MTKKSFSLSEIQQQVIKNDIKDEDFTKDMERRIAFVMQHKYEQCFKRLKDEWEPKLKVAGVRSIPLDKDEFAALVFSQPSYKSRTKRETS